MYFVRGSFFIRLLLFAAFGLLGITKLIAQTSKVLISLVNRVYTRLFTSFDFTATFAFVERARIKKLENQIILRDFDQISLRK